MLGYILRSRKVWRLTIGFAAYGCSFCLFLTWLPNYLVQLMHLSILRSAGFTAISWAFATLSDLLVGGMLLGLAVFGTTLTTDPTWAIV